MGMTKVVSRENTQHYLWGDHCEGWHLLKSTELSVIQEHMPPAAAEVTHYHEFARQFFFILSGEAIMEIDGHSFVLRAQEGIYVPPKTAHRLSNPTKLELHFVVVSTPMSHGDRITVDADL